VEKQKNRILAAVGKYGLPAGFFTLFFIYLLVYIDPGIIYSCNGYDLYSYVHFTCTGEISKANIVDHHLYGDHRYILELTPSYLKGIVSIPGGVTNLLVTLTIYACHCSIIGALGITAIAWLLYFLFPAYIRRCGGPTLCICRYLPAIFLLAICGRYELNYLAYLIPILGALLLSIVYQRLSSNSSVRRIFVFSLLFWPAYWFFQWAALLFALFVFIHEFFQRPKTFFVPAIAAAVNIGLLALVERYGVSVENGIHVSEFFLPIVPPIIVIAYFPLVAIILNPAAARILFCLQRPIVSVSLLIRSLVLLLIVMGFSVWSVNEQDYRYTRMMARTLYHLQNRQWEQVLKENTSFLFRKFPVTNDPLQQFMVHAVDQALYRTGQLGERMFSYPQASFSAEPLLLFKNTLTYGHAKWASSLDLFMDLGFFNLAEKVVGELVECMGPYPPFIYRSALIQIAKGNTQAASVYLHKLNRMPFCRKDARQLLQMINDGTALASDSRIALLRARMDTSDYFLYQTDEETMLRSLLNRNPDNKMAYEYLMAYYLQTGQLKKIADNVFRAADLGYTYCLPRHWEEALCIYAYEDSATTKMQELPLRGETVAELDRYLQSYAPYQNDPSKELLAASTLKAEFGATYFYYYTFMVNHGANR
jgi:hypothetical protein